MSIWFCINKTNCVYRTCFVKNNTSTMNSNYLECTYLKYTYIDEVITNTKSNINARLGKISQFSKNWSQKCAKGYNAVNHGCFTKFLSADMTARTYD